MIHTSMFQKHIHKVKFYTSADDFTQAPLVLLVTNIMSDSKNRKEAGSWVLTMHLTVGQTLVSG